MTKVADYIRFEVYLPVHFYTYINGDDPSERRLRKDALDGELVGKFAKEAVKLFGGATQAHPAEGPPYQGWWWSNDTHQIYLDNVTYFFVLVPLDRLSEAESFFEKWQQRFAKSMNQEVILVVRWPLQTLGGFL